MELNLLKERFACWEERPELTQSCEAGTETIVPDYCPDIARVADASGTLLLRGCEVTEGRAVVSGAVRVTVLYLPEGERRVRALPCTLPLEAAFDLPSGERFAALRMEGTLDACEVRMLNPRKLFLGASASLTLTPYRQAETQVCTAVENAEKHGVQTLLRTCELSPICTVREKEFSFTDELTLPGLRAPAQELLRHSMRARLTECRCVGGKLIVKGVLSAELLYLNESETAESFCAQLPFSQVLDGCEGDVDADVSVHLVDCGAQLSGEDGRTVLVNATLHAIAALRSAKSVPCVADLYGIGCELGVQSESAALSLPPQRELRSVPVRELIETGSEVRTVLSCLVNFSPVSVQREEGRLRASAAVKLLYMDEDGALLTAQRRIELAAQAELPQDASIRARVQCGDEVVCVPAAGGAELRFPADFSLLLSRTQRTDCLTALTAEPREADADEPSLILRAPQGQSLWQLAKAHRTTVSAILEANELAAETDADAHALLLIPRGR